MQCHTLCDKTELLLYLNGRIHSPPLPSHDLPLQPLKLGLLLPRMLHEPLLALQSLHFLFLALLSIPPPRLLTGSKLRA